MKARGMKVRSLLISATVLAASAFPARGETLYEAMRDAYYFNPSVEAARSNLRALGETVPIAEAGFLPTLAFQAQQQIDQRLTERNSFPSASSRPLTGALIGQINLYDGGETANNVSQAKANVEAAYSALNATEQMTLLSAVDAFFDVLRDHELRELTRENLKNLQEELDASKARFEVGEVTLTDVAQAESRVAQANSGLIQAEGALRNSAAEYRGVVGRLPTKLEPPENLPPLPETLIDAETDAIATHPTIRSARANERAAVFAIRSALADKLPTLDLQGTLQGTLSDSIVGDSLFSNDNDDTRSASLNLTLTFNAPIYQGGRVDAEVRQARHIASQARAEYHDAVRTVQQNVSTSWQAIVTARGSIDAELQRVRAAQIAFEGVSEELRVGSRDTLDVLNAEAELLAAQIALVQAVRNHNVAAYTLLAAIGRLDPESVNLEPVFDAAADPNKLNGTVSYGYPDDATTAWRFPWRP